MIGYCVLPLPLIPLPELIEVIGKAEKLLSSPGKE